MTNLRRRFLSLAVGAAGGLAAAVAIVALFESFGNDDPAGRFVNIGAGQQTAPASSGETRQSDGAGMSLHDTPRELPALAFRDGDGRPMSLAAFRGQVVLLNLWATWCGPCREEMPTLDRLQAELGGPDFQVLALSIDRAGLGVVSEFYDEIDIQHLARYIDDSTEVSRRLKAVGLPTTLLIDREGREIARHVGSAEWDAPEMIAFLQRQLGRESEARWPAPADRGAQLRAENPAARSAPLRTRRAARLRLPQARRPIRNRDPSAITIGSSS